MNMIEFLAGDLCSGYAYVRIGSEFFLVQPPYIVTNLVTINEETVQLAVDVYKYRPAKQPTFFHNWDEFFYWLNRQFVVAREQAGIPLPSQADTIQYLSECSIKDIQDFLSIISNKFIPQRRFDDARRIIKAIMTHAKVIKSNDDLQLEIENINAQISRAEG